MHSSPKAYTILLGVVLSSLLFSPGLDDLRAQDYLNPDLPNERRVDDLVARMTLDEKISQMMDRAPAIPRLKIPEYNWWNEALHGVARSGLATVFPQAIGFASTWDNGLVREMAGVIGDEARAKHHDYARKGNHERYSGITIWSPNINIFRDPRWGRGQETYGEDPFLTGRLAVEFVHGLQGDDPKYLKTVSTVKHYAVHSGPEPERHEFDAVVDERDLHETYLRQFEAAIKEGGAYSLMCAYNRVDGRAACGSEPLLQEILRDDWDFQGYVVSDCGAVEDIYQRHRVVKTAPEAAAIAVKSGTDLECGIGRFAYKALPEAVKQGLISEAEIDRAVKRLFTARFKLGMFDPPDRVGYAQIPITELDSPEHRALALKVARESIVLLKNERGILPLSKNLGTLAVIGPNADEWRMLLGNYNGIPADPITPLRGIREAVSDKTRVLFSHGSDLAEGVPIMATLDGPVLMTVEGKPGLNVEYFDNRALQGKPIYSAIENKVDVNWHDGAPRAGMAPDDFSVRWTGTLRPAASGSYRFGLVGTMKYRLYFDDELIVQSTYAPRDDEYPDPRPTNSPFLQLVAGRSYKLRVEGEESYGSADLQLLWSLPQEALAADAVKIARQADAVVLFLGLTPRLEGEEMRVNIPGFRGGDRTSLDLPAPQEQLLQRIASLGKPTVLVLLSGSALAINWAQEHVPAIIEAWYPGQAAGTAIADVLFGDYNPAGRLPVTFYRSVADIPPFSEYSMEGRTYRYFAGKPLYPFGHGLSYTSFAYSGLAISPETIPMDGQASVHVNITNRGKRAGEEVVQLYAQFPGSRVKRPIKQLVGYQRVALKPGETRGVEIELRAQDLAYWDVSAGRWAVEPGTMRLLVGSSSADIRASKTVSVGPGAPPAPPDSH